MSTTKLTEKQKRFCEEYLIDRNATQAYIRAGYSVKKKITAEQNSSKLLKNTKVQAYLTELSEHQAERTQITADIVLKELAKIALTETEITGKEKMKALELLGKHLGMFTANADNSDTLAKLDEVLGRIEGEI